MREQTMIISTDAYPSLPPSSWINGQSAMCRPTVCGPLNKNVVFDECDSVTALLLLCCYCGRQPGWDILLLCQPSPGYYCVQCQGNIFIPPVFTGRFTQAWNLLAWNSPQPCKIVLWLLAGSLGFNRGSSVCMQQKHTESFRAVQHMQAFLQLYSWIWLQPAEWAWGWGSSANCLPETCRKPTPISTGQQLASAPQTCIPGCGSHILTYAFNCMQNFNFKCIYHYKLRVKGCLYDWIWFQEIYPYFWNYVGAQIWAINQNPSTAVVPTRGSIK